MFSYKEFPEQVTSSILEFSRANGFSLSEKKDDHYLRYTNVNWDLIFICEHGAIELSMVNLKDGYQYSINDIIKSFFPDSPYSKKINDNLWGSLKTIQFLIDTLTEHFKNIDTFYNKKKGDLENCKMRSSRLIDFSLNHGSKNLKSQFSMASSSWIELASIEYIAWNEQKQDSPSIIEKVKSWFRM